MSPQQSRQLLRLLNELQKTFRDLSERVTARLEVLQVCLQQVEQTEQVKVVRHLLLCLLKLFPATGTGAKTPPIWDFPCMPLPVQQFSLHIMSFLEVFLLPARLCSQNMEPCSSSLLDMELFGAGWNKPCNHPQNPCAEGPPQTPNALFPLHTSGIAVPGKELARTKTSPQISEQHPALHGSSHPRQD